MRTRALRKGILTLGVGAVAPLLVLTSPELSDSTGELPAAAAVTALLVAPYLLLAALAPRVSTTAWAVALAAMVTTTAAVTGGALLVDSDLALGLVPLSPVQLAIAAVTWLTQGSAERRTADRGRAAGI